MPVPLSGFLGALGAAFGGYGQDVQTNLQRQRQAILDRQNLDLHAAQMEDFKAQAGLRQVQAQQRQDTMNAQQRAAAALVQTFPDNPLAKDVAANGFTPGTDYVGELKSERDNWLKEQAAQRSADAATKAQAAAQLLQDQRDKAAEGRLRAMIESRDASEQWAPSGAVDPQTGAPILFNKKTGEQKVMTNAMPNAKGGAAGKISGQTMQTMARMGMSFNDLKQAIDQMDADENDPAFRQALTPLAQAKGAMSETHPSETAHGITGGINNALGSYLSAKAQENLANTNPRLRTYLNNKQRVATAFTELLPRPNQQLLQMEKGLSGMDAGWTPDLIKNVQARRRGGLDVLQNILQGQGMVDANGAWQPPTPSSPAVPTMGGGRGSLPATSPSVAKPSAQFGAFGDLVKRPED